MLLQKFWTNRGFSLSFYTFMQQYLHEILHFGFVYHTLQADNYQLICQFTSCIISLCVM